MARLFLTPLDLGGNELRNARLQSLPSAPNSPTAGQVYYNSTANRAEIFDGAVWQPCSFTVSGTGLVLTAGDLHIDPATLDLTANPQLADLQGQVDALSGGQIDLSAAVGTGLVYDAGLISVDAAYINGLIAAATGTILADAVTKADDQTITGVKTFDAAATPQIEETIDPTTVATSKSAVNVEYVQTVVNNLVNGAPGLLDTLGEIATALAADETAQDALVARIAQAETDIDTNTGAITDLTARVVTLETTPARTRKYAATLATSATSYAVAHGLGTTDVHVQVYATSGAQVETGVTVTDANTVTLSFATAPAAGAFRVVVVG